MIHGKSLKSFFSYENSSILAFYMLLIKTLFSDVDVNSKNVVQKLAEINSQRPRKETDRQNKVLYLKELRKLAADNKLGFGIDVKVN